MKTAIHILFCCLALNAKIQAKPPSLGADSLKKIQFEQKLGNQISGSLSFVDENGAPVQFDKFLHRKPVILLMGYYECPMLCSLVLNGLVESLQDLKAAPGEKFEIIEVSIAENEKPSLARAKKQTYLKRYGRRGSTDGWHFLTGQQKNIAALADEIGFRYAYDPTIKQFAHPSGLVVLTPDGKISRYFFGVEFPPAELNAALVEAGSEKIGSPIKQLFLLCFHYNPISGKYGAIIMTILRIAGIATLAAVALLIFKKGKVGRVTPCAQLVVKKQKNGANEVRRSIREAEK
jgi:protein SCO1/2